MLNIIRCLTSPKRVVALIILIINFILARKIFKIEYRWYRAHRRIWPLLTYQRKLGSKTRTLKEMMDYEDANRDNLNWDYSGTKHLVSAMHGTEYRGRSSLHFGWVNFTCFICYSFFSCNGTETKQQSAQRQIHHTD